MERGMPRPDNNFGSDEPSENEELFQIYIVRVVIAVPLGVSLPLLA
jgi:hypothetical protein